MGKFYFTREGRADLYDSSINFLLVRTWTTDVKPGCIQPQTCRLVCNEYYFSKEY